MPNSQNRRHFAEQLLQQDKPLNDAQYKEYRMNLENTLANAERKEKLAYRVMVTSFVVGLTLMFIGAYRVVNAPDPRPDNVTVLSVLLGVIHFLAAATFYLSLASYFSRFRPRVRKAKEQLRDASILELQRTNDELRKQIEELSQDIKTSQHKDQS